jgi:hypothetical protein
MPQNIRNRPEVKPQNIEASILTWVDQVARLNGFDGMLAAFSHVNTTDLAKAAMAGALREWSIAVKSYQVPVDLATTWDDVRTALPVFTPPPPPSFENVAKKHIDDSAGRIVNDVVGDRAEEYRQAENEATTWAAAGYSGAAPATVASWSRASGLTDRQACDSIVAQAAAWRSALAQIRDARLGCKAIAQAGDPVRAVSQWETFNAAIRSALSI